MTKKKRQELIDKVWANIAPELNGYSKTIENLLGMLTDAQLKEYVELYHYDDGKD